MNATEIEKDHALVRSILATIVRQATLQRKDSFDSQSEGLDQRTMLLEKKLKDYRAEIGEKRFEHQIRAFKVLVANPDQSRVEQKANSQFYCTEKSIIANFENLFGFRCDVFAKMLYIRMAKGLDHARIDFMRFIRVFDGFLDDSPKRRNQAVFNLYDVKN